MSIVRFIPLATLLLLVVGSVSQSQNMMNSSSSFSFWEIPNFDAYAEEGNGYKMLEDVYPVVTFTFRDGVETHKFPLFEMGENLVSNSGTTFTLGGVIDNSPLLYKAMDEAYKYRFSSENGFEYQFKHFDVDISFVKSDLSFVTLEYSNCRIANHIVQTLYSGDYESYFNKIGFVTIDLVDFKCSGVTIKNDTDVSRGGLYDGVVDHFTIDYNFANNVKTSVTLEFDNGMETIEFPVFELIQGYEEVILENGRNVSVTPQFKVEGILDNYPLLYNAILNSIKVSGDTSSYNTDFDASVKFTNDDTILRGLDFRDCTVDGSLITTKSDKEESFTGQSGFAIVHEITFDCAGLKPVNPYYDSFLGWNTSELTSTYEETNKNYLHDIKVISTFRYNNGVETIEFPIFEQGSTLTDNASGFNQKSIYPAFDLKGVVGNYPLLYKAADYSRSMNAISGTHSRILFDVDVELVSNDTTLRSFQYDGCRIINYDITTNTGVEESYIGNKFALENTFSFECQGYTPKNPMYDKMHSISKADLESTKDLRNTSQWGPRFYQE